MASAAETMPDTGKVQLNDRQYRLWKDMLERRTGVQIANGRDDFARRRIAERMAAVGVSDPDVYFRQVLDSLDGVREWGVLLDALLIKETRFFRHRPSFDLIRQYVLSQLRARPEQRSLNAWSVGCSTGEETYSLAIAMDEAFRSAGRPPGFAVLGTDISRAALAQARRGAYPLAAVGEARHGVRSGYFVTSGDRCEMAPALKRRVAFVEDNILDGGSGALAQCNHVIMCQNLLIYFRRWRRRQVVERLVSALAPGGLLVLGPGELSDWLPAGTARYDFPDVQAYVRVDRRSD